MREPAAERAAGRRYSWMGLPARLRSLRLSTQLAWLTALILSGAILINSWIDATFEFKGLKGNLTAQAAAQARNVASGSVDQVVRNDLAGLEALLLHSAWLPAVLSVQVTDAEGRVYGSVARGPDGSPRVSSGGLRLAVPRTPEVVVESPAGRESQAVVTVWAPIENAGLLGWVRVNYSAAGALQARTGVLLRHFVFGAVVSLVGALLVWLFTRRTARELAAATEFAARLHVVRGQQTALPPSSLEIVTLKQALNRVSLRLQEQEQALAGLNAHLHALLHSAGDGIVTLRTDGRITSFNAAAERMFQRADSAVVGKEVAVLLQELPPPLARLGPEMDDMQEFAGELTGRRPDGTTFPVEVSVKEVRNGQRAIIMIVRDISDRKRSEAEIHALHRLNELILHCTADGLVGMNGRGEITFANHAAARMLGWRRHQLIGQTGHALIHHTRADGSPYPESECPSRLVLDGGAGVHVSDELFWRKDGTSFPVEYLVSPLTERGSVSGVVVAFRDITERKRSEEQIRHMAHHDALTGLPNRVLMQDRLAHALSVARRNGTLAALMFIDLDRFKSINDTLGHDVGDRLLQAVAARLVTCVRAVDTVARVGGDEFVIILHDIAEVEDARVVAGKVLHAFEDAFMAGTHELRVSPSIGISLCPRDGTDSQELMRHADIAMYCAKNAGRNTFCLYSPGMAADVGAT